MKFYVWRDFSRARNLETNETVLLCRNSSRYVYIFSDCVLKLDSQSAFYGEQCEQEAVFYTKLNKEDREYFAEIIESGYYNDIPYVIQKRVFGEYCLNADTRISLKKRFNLEDLHSRNVFLRTDTGQPVIVDYGMNNE